MAVATSQRGSLARQPLRANITGTGRKMGGQQSQSGSRGLLLLKTIIHKVSVFRSVFSVLSEHFSMKTYGNHHLMKLGHFVLLKEFI